ncbi:MAG: glycosyltransferase, partial [Coriobacteriia bacterium]|nr:glycosyltransferase [Coriobacteriia bacterium]
MRVTMINKYYYPHLGGIEYHMRDLARGLLRAGVDVDVLVSNEESHQATDTVDGVRVERLARIFAVSSAPVAPGMPTAIRHLTSDAEDGTDLIHLHSPYPWGEISWLSARAGLPSVLTYHSDIVRQRVLGGAYRPVLERVLDKVDLIVAGSPNMVKHSELLAPRAEKCRVVPYGIDVDRFAETPETLARADELRAGHTRPIVLFVGRLVYYKGADVLVKAMERVDADLVLVGRGPLEGKLRESVVARGFDDRVSFLSPLPDDELVAWYHAADVFCLPSVARSEAFGLVQIEAHAAGTPVVSTDLTTGVPFANQDGVTGLIVPVDDVAELAKALDTLLGDDELRERLGRQAKERARRDFTVA